MKKIFLFAAAAAATLLSLASCNKNSESSVTTGNLVPAELSFVNAAQTQTKGYLADETFFDVAIDKLHAGEAGAHEVSTTPREMRISAFLDPQAGTAENYFVDYTYAKGADGLWHHDPKIYWPVAGTLSFLAYSTAIPFDPKDVTWNEENASESVVLNVLENRTQDDIVFCSVANRASTTANAAGSEGAVPMVFKHAQAWLEFQIKVANAAMEDIITIKSIEIENIYNTGELTIENNAGAALASWNFRHEQKKNVVFEDNYDLYDAPLTEGVQYMDMLLPEQGKTSFVITYTLAGQDKELKYRYDLASSGTSNWIMGDKYIYEVSFVVNEITVAPTVKAYSNGDVEDLTPQQLI